jgi:hypothetical protein
MASCLRVCHSCARLANPFALPARQNPLSLTKPKSCRSSSTPGRSAQLSLLPFVRGFVAVSEATLNPPRRRMAPNGSIANSRLRAIANHLEGPDRNPGGPRHASSSSSPRPTGIDFSRLSTGIMPGEQTVDETSLWCIVAAAALMAYHQEHAIGQLWKHICSHAACDTSQLVMICRRIRETCLKASVLVGFPRVSCFPSDGA